MSRDYAKRSSQHKTSATNRKIIAKRKPLPTRYSNRSQVTSAQAKRRPIKSSRRKSFHFPWRRMLALIMISILVILTLLVLLKNGDRVNQRIHPRAPVYTVKPVETDKSSTNIIPIPKVVFENKKENKLIKTPYILQLGVYTQSEDLIVLKNKLNKIKIKFHTTRVPRMNNTYYRVEVGPFADETIAEKNQQILRHYRIFSVITKSE